MNDMLVLGLIAGIAAGVSFSTIFTCFYWLRRDQHRLEAKMLRAIHQANTDPDSIFAPEQKPAAQGELIAQFKVNHGRQVLSVMEADGKRFIHVDGELPAPERARMVRYLKSEGFMS